MISLDLDSISSPCSTPGSIKKVRFSPIVDISIVEEDSSSHWGGDSDSGVSMPSELNFSTSSDAETSVGSHFSFDMSKTKENTSCLADFEEEVSGRITIANKDGTKIGEVILHK